MPTTKPLQSARGRPETHFCDPYNVHGRVMLANKLFDPTGTARIPPRSLLDPWLAARFQSVQSVSQSVSSVQFSSVQLVWRPPPSPSKTLGPRKRRPAA